MGTTSITLTMIVKDEAECIGNCLAGIKDFVEEIIVVDTGSKDETIEICKTFGALVHEFQWNGNFADARNYALKYATKPWVMWLDADEVIDVSDAPRLLETPLFEPFDFMRVRLVNYFGEEFNPDRFTQLASIRLFRNKLGICFENAIHESLKVFPNGKPGHGVDKLGFLDLRVHHFGYLQNTMQKKDKRNRNVEILRKELHIGNPWMTYHLAAEYYQLSEHEKALNYINLAIKQFLMQGKLPPAIVYQFKYAIISALKDWDQGALGIDKAIMLYPDYVDLHFYKGYILLHQEKYEEAIAAFNRCIELGEGNLDYYTVRGVGSFQAWYYKGLCYQKLKQTKEAVNSYIKAAADSPAFTAAQEDLRQICQGNPEAFSALAEMKDLPGQIKKLFS